MALIVFITTIFIPTLKSAAPQGQYKSPPTVVLFDTIILVELLKYFGPFVWIEKSHYNSRISLHEAPTKNGYVHHRLLHGCLDLNQIDLNL